MLLLAETIKKPTVCAESAVKRGQTTPNKFAIGLFRLSGLWRVTTGRADISDKVWADWQAISFYLQKFWSVVFL